MKDSKRCLSLFNINKNVTVRRKETANVFRSLAFRVQNQLFMHCMFFHDKIICVIKLLPAKKFTIGNIELLNNDEKCIRY